MFTNRQTAAYRALFWCGIFFGLGISVKWEAIFSILAILPCLLYIEVWLKRPTILVLLRTTALYAVFLIIIPLSIYALSYVPYFYHMDSSNFIQFILNLQKNMFDYHTNYTEHVTHPYASNWWTWPLIIRPLSVYFYQESGSALASSVVLMGNPAIWWYGLMVFIFSLLVLIWQLPKFCSRQTYLNKISNSIKLKHPATNKFTPNLLKPNYRVNFFLCLSIISLYAPWIFIGRLSFIYYFYEVVPFLILIIINSFQLDLWQKRTYLIYVYLFLVIALFIIFYPALSGVPFLRSYVVNYLLWFNSWNF